MGAEPACQLEGERGESSPLRSLNADFLSLGSHMLAKQSTPWRKPDVLLHACDGSAAQTPEQQRSLASWAAFARPVLVSS